MTITTKFNVGDKPFTIIKGKIFQVYVDKILTTNYKQLGTLDKIISDVKYDCSIKYQTYKEQLSQKYPNLIYKLPVKNTKSFTLNECELFNTIDELKNNLNNVIYYDNNSTNK